MARTVKLVISCTGLRDADFLSKSDPLVTVFDDNNNELGRTECIADELNPKFKEKIVLDYHPFDEQKLIFKVWDIDDWNNDINKADFLGEMSCNLQHLVSSGNFSAPLRYQGDDFGKIYIKTEEEKSFTKVGKKGKKGKKGKRGKEEIVSDTYIKDEMIDETMEETFKTVNDETVDNNSSLDNANEHAELVKHSETMCTEAFTPASNFTTTSHPLRAAAGADGYLSDPGGCNNNNYNNRNNDSEFHSADNSSKPYHFIQGKTSLYEMSLTPLEDISCISPSPRTQKRPPNTVIKVEPEAPPTLNHLTGDYCYDDDDTYEMMNRDIPSPLYRSTATEMTPRDQRVTRYERVTRYPASETKSTSPSSIYRPNVRYIETQTSERSLLQTDKIEVRSPYSNGFSGPLYELPPTVMHPPTTSHKLQQQHQQLESQSPNLVWCQYSSPDKPFLQGDEDPNRTEFYSIINNDDQVLDKRPPVLDDFEKTWDNVLNNQNTPDWASVQPQQWRIWFEFYKANSKVSKMRSLLVTTMMGTRDTCMRGWYQDANLNTVYLPTVKSTKFIEDKSILQEFPPLNYPSTEINVINVDPIQVCLHLQKSGYKPSLYVPANPVLPGGEWRNGGIGPLEEFIRRSNYYTCLDDIDSPITLKKRKGSMGLLSATDCLINTNVLVFRESQQRNYTFMPHASSIDVLSLTPLPKVKRGKETAGRLSKEEVHLLKRKLAILFSSAGSIGADCLVLSPFLTEGRRAPHRHVAEIIQTTCRKYNGLFKRVIIAVERDVIFHDISKQVLATYHDVFPHGHIALPALPPLPTSQDIILWHWVGDNGNWYPYDPRQNEVIDAIYLRGETKMSMKGTDSEHPGYVVDFNHFTVSSLSSGASRKIGRFKLVYDKIVKNKKSASRPVGNWVSTVEETDKLYRTAGEESLQLKSTIPVWQWLTNENKWFDYGQEQSDKLESAYLQHGTACVILHIQNNRFSVNTKSRVQTNTVTGKQRKVQRVLRDSSYASPPPRASSTPTPLAVKTKSHLTNVVWEHQGTDKSWLPFDANTCDVIERAYNDDKTKLTVVFNNQAYWIYLDPYYVLLDPKVMEEYEIRRTTVTTSINSSMRNSSSFRTPPVVQRSHPPVTPMSNSTMIEEKRAPPPPPPPVVAPPPIPESSAMYTTAPDNSAVFTEVDGKTVEKLNLAQQAPSSLLRTRAASNDSVKYDGNNNQMLKTFMRHPGVMASQATSVSRDPTRDFSWEWQDPRTGLWHSLPEFIACFLEPASKTQYHGGVRTSRLTHGNQQINVRADFIANTITGHLPGKPEKHTPLRRVEVCFGYS